MNTISAPKTTQYTINLFGKGNCFRIAAITDLHDKKCLALVEILKQISPDVILFIGDTLERNNNEHKGFSCDSLSKYHGNDRIWRMASQIGRKIDKCILGRFEKNKDHDLPWGLEFLRLSTQIAPVYISVGNHEWFFTEEDLSFFDRFHITLLDNRDVVLKTCFDNEILIGGLSTKYNVEWLKSFSSKQGIKILMSHHPEYYFKLIKDTELDQFQLILSGHCHGGQMRYQSHFGKEIALFAPGQGFFPKHVHGIEHIRNHNGWLIISSGVSKTTYFPRWGNPCEVVVVDLK